MTYQEYPELENLDGFRFEVDIRLSSTFNVTQSKGHSSLATFFGTGFGTCGYNNKQEEIRRVMHLINKKNFLIKVR